MNPWLLIVGCWMGMAVIMAILWEWQRRHGDAGVVDVAWGLGVGLTTLAFALALDTPLPRRILVATMTGLWSIRLSSYIFKRLLTLPEDGRYQTLKETWGAEQQKRMFAFYQVQALWAVLFALPMLLAMRNPHPDLGWFDAAGVGIWLMALIGEAVSDRQLHRFRTDPANKGKVCREGLWRYSRHPNYFFEWLHWFAYPCMAWPAELGWLSLLGPVAMLYFLLKVTGIPVTEWQALKSRGEAYRDYQRTTSIFFPWPPRKTSFEKVT